MDAKFDERLSLLGLLIDTVDAELRSVVETDTAIIEYLRVLKLIRYDLSSDSRDSVAVLNSYAESEKNALRIGEKANSIDYETRDAYNYTIRSIEQSIDTFKCDNSIPNNNAAFKRIKSSYDKTVSAHKDSIKSAQK